MIELVRLFGRRFTGVVASCQSFQAVEDSVRALEKVIVVREIGVWVKPWHWIGKLSAGASLIADDAESLLDGCARKRLLQLGDKLRCLAEVDLGVGGG